VDQFANLGRVFLAAFIAFSAFNISSMADSSQGSPLSPWISDRPIAIFFVHLFLIFWQVLDT
jgi:hypothetical protein